MRLLACGAMIAPVNSVNPPVEPNAAQTIPKPRIAQQLLAMIDQSERLEPLHNVIIILAQLFFTCMIFVKVKGENGRF
jgi:hypothetical protein